MAATDGKDDGWSAPYENRNRGVRFRRPDRLNPHTHGETGVSVASAEVRGKRGRQ